MSSGTRSIMKMYTWQEDSEHPCVRLIKRNRTSQAVLENKKWPMTCIADRFRLILSRHTPKYTNQQTV